MSDPSRAALLQFLGPLLGYALHASIQAFLPNSRVKMGIIKYGDNTTNVSGNWMTFKLVG